VEPGSVGLFPEAVGDVSILSLDRDGHSFCARKLLHDLQPTKECFALLQHRFPVLLQQWLTFGTVRDDVFDLRFKLSVRGESRAASANNTGFSDAIQDLCGMWCHD
jgi:hypothetical protein